jgi:hypothetical protein
MDEKKEKKKLKKLHPARFIFLSCRWGSSCAPSA